MTERESGAADAEHGVAISLLKNGQFVHNVCHLQASTLLIQQAAKGSRVEC